MVKTRPLALAAAFWLLNMADLLLTQVAVREFGAVEGNPVMSAVLQQGLFPAFLLKSAVAGLVAVVAGLFWFAPTVRRVVALGNLVLLAVIGYQVLGMLLAY